MNRVLYCTKYTKDERGKARDLAELQELVRNPPKKVPGTPNMRARAPTSPSAQALERCPPFCACPRVHHCAYGGRRPGFPDVHDVHDAVGLLLPNILPLLVC